MSDDYRNAMRARGEQLLREANNGADPCRVSAFGAIRRAAEVARFHDRESSQYDYYIQQKDAQEKADAIRRAIGAAIGSDKA